MVNPVKAHYQQYPYPRYPLLASVRRCDTYALNLTALWARFNGVLPPPAARNILIAGSGSFSPYPWAVSNPDAAVTALDLSERSLERARLHCLLHGRRNVVYRCGDLLDDAAVGGDFGVIDSYGVLHHLENPVAGLKALARQLMPGGIMRIMLYSRYARREEEAIRRAFKLTGVRTPAAARQVMDRAGTGSRLARYLASSDEITYDAGIADALLHPRVHTFRIDDVLEILRQAGLVPLLFAHAGAGENVLEEITRLRRLEKERRSPGNFVVYLAAHHPPAASSTREKFIMLNPCLTSAVSPFAMGALHILDRIGCGGMTLGYGDRRFLRRFRRPVAVKSLPDDVTKVIEVYKRGLLLIECEL